MAVIALIVAIVAALAAVAAAMFAYRQVEYGRSQAASAARVAELEEARRHDELRPTMAAHADDQGVWQRIVIRNDGTVPVTVRMVRNMRAPVGLAGAGDLIDTSDGSLVNEFDLNQRAEVGGEIAVRFHRDYTPHAGHVVRLQLQCVADDGAEWQIIVEVAFPLTPQVY